MKKYLILDFGNVLAYATTGYWFITPSFITETGLKEDAFDEILSSMQQHKDILSRQASTLDDEYQLFYDFYSATFKTLNFSISEEKIKKIVDNFIHTSDKYTLFPHIKEYLEVLSKKYTLLLLTDNWPCVFNTLKEAQIDKYFTKVYVSSIYGSEKKDKVFFDYPINDFKIKKGEALFVDDTLELVEIGQEKGLEGYLMDPFFKHPACPYPIIHSIKELI